MRPAVIDFMFFFSHSQLHRGRHGIGDKLDFISVVVVLPRKKCDGVREGQGRRGEIRE